MKPWNPYAMTFNGEPITGQVPPKVVVYGPPMTVQQGAFLQYVFALFQSQARLSVVQNPTTRGRFADGTPYTIECSGGSCTCTVWTVGGGSGTDRIVSGILFMYSAHVAVNEGTSGAPSAVWRLEDVSGTPTNTRGLYGLPRAPYNIRFSTNSAVWLGGKEKYIYPMGLVGRYGVVFANSRRDNTRVIGFTKAKDRAIAISATSAAIQFFQSDEIPPARMFPKFGAALAPIQEIDFSSPPFATMAEDSGTGDSETYYSPERYHINRGGTEIAFTGTIVAGATTPADIVAHPNYGGSVYPVKRPFRASGFVGEAGGIFVGTRMWESSSIGYLWRRAEHRLWRSQRFEDTFSTPSVVHAVPQNDIGPTDWPSAGWVGSDPWAGPHVNASHMTSSLTVNNKSAPGFVKSANLITYPASHWVLRGSSVATGGISGSLGRQEKLHNMSPHYVGDTMVLLQKVTEMDFHETCMGATSIKYMDGYWAFGEASTPVPSLSSISLTTPSSPRDVDKVTTQTIEGRLSWDTFITLNDGERLYIRKYRYTETSTSSAEYRNLYSDTGGHILTREKISNTLSYTVDREQRALLVYDPELDLLCYSEILFHTTRDFSVSYEYEVSSASDDNHYEHSGGGPMPTPPTWRLIIECRGVKKTVYSSPCVLTGWDIVSLLPATGISPFVPPIAGSSIPEGSRILRTSGGFVRWFVRETGLAGTARDLSCNGDHRIGDFNCSFSDVRGIAPEIDCQNYPTLEYIKTPETGAAYMRATIRETSSSAEVVYDSKFFVDVSGIREVETVLPSLVVGPNEEGVPF